MGERRQEGKRGGAALKIAIKYIQQVFNIPGNRTYSSYTDFPPVEFVVQPSKKL